MHGSSPGHVFVDNAFSGRVFQYSKSVFGRGRWCESGSAFVLSGIGGFRLLCGDGNDAIRVCFEVIQVCRFWFKTMHFKSVEWRAGER